MRGGYVCFSPTSEHAIIVRMVRLMRGLFSITAVMSVTVILATALGRHGARPSRQRPPPPPHPRPWGLPAAAAGRRLKLAGAP